MFIPLQEAVVISYIGGLSLAGLACTASPPFTTFFRWLYRVDIVRGVRGMHAGVCCIHKVRVPWPELRGDYDVTQQF